MHLASKLGLLCLAQVRSWCKLGRNNSFFLYKSHLFLSTSVDIMCQLQVFAKGTLTWWKQPQLQYRNLSQKYWRHRKYAVLRYKTKNNICSTRKNQQRWDVERKSRRGCLQSRQKLVYQHEGKLAPEQCTDPAMPAAATISLGCWQSEITTENREMGLCNFYTLFGRKSVQVSCVKLW